MNRIDCKLLELTNFSLSQTLLRGHTLFDEEKNTPILSATIEYILSTERFEEPLFRKFLMESLNPSRSLLYLLYLL